MVDEGGAAAEPMRPAAGSQSGDESSSDDNVDYQTLPDFYDSEADEQDEEWVRKQRKGRSTDAILSCPACMETVSIECQRHAQHSHQYRAMFVQNCRVDTTQIVRMGPHAKAKAAKGGRGGGAGAGAGEAAAAAAGEGEEAYNPVQCATCGTEIALYDKDEVYHFFHVFPSCP